MRFDQSRLSLGKRLLTAGMLALSSVAAQADINTVPSWNGTDYISSFGVPNTATYGQLVTVYPGASPLTGFSFRIGNCTADVTFRGHVYAWNGSMALGPSLFDSAPQTLAASSAFHTVTFNVGSLALPAGQYILFASTSEDQASAPNSACQWGSVPNATYPGGQFYFINNATTVSQWTGSTWSTITQDLAFTVTGLNLTGIPTLSEYGMVALVLLMAAGAMWTVRRNQS